jgi:hypothetical protein
MGEIAVVVTAVFAGLLAVSLRGLVPPSTRPIPRAPFSGPKSIPDALVAGVPVVFEGVPVARHAAEMVSPEWLIRTCGDRVLERVKETAGPVVLNYVDGQLWETWPDGASGPRYTPRNLTVESFWAAVRGLRGKHWLYFNSHVAALGPKTVGALRPLGLLFPSAPPDVPAGRDSNPEAHVWLGSEGATASTHYDTSENIYVQLYGRKRFLLWEPRWAAAFHLYPALHAGYRHGQFDWFNRDLSLYPLAASLPPPLEAVLAPGDVLYLPRYWLHNVEAVDESISVNLWANSGPYWAAEEVYAAPLPFEEEWDKDTKALAVLALVRMVLERTPPGPGAQGGRATPEQRIDALLRSRFDSLFAGKAVRAKHLGHPVQCPTAKASSTFLTDALRAKFHEKADNIASLLKRIPDDGIRDIYIDNWIEYTSFWAAEKGLVHLLECARGSS